MSSQRVCNGNTLLGLSSFYKSDLEMHIHIHHEMLNERRNDAGKNMITQGMVCTWHNISSEERLGTEFKCFNKNLFQTEPEEDTIKTNNLKSSNNNDFINMSEINNQVIFNDT